MTNKVENTLKWLRNRVKVYHQESYVSQEGNFNVEVVGKVFKGNLPYHMVHTLKKNSDMVMDNVPDEYEVGHFICEKIVFGNTRSDQNKIEFFINEYTVTKSED